MSVGISARQRGSALWRSLKSPLVLNWQLIDLPSYFNASNTSGNKQGRIEVVVRPEAKIGETGFLKFNTSPRAAAPGLQGGNLAIPFVIVE